MNDATLQPSAVHLDGIDYEISRTAFRAHYQVTTGDGRLVGLIEVTETEHGQRVMARPASGTAMTQPLLLKIAALAQSQGILG